MNANFLSLSDEESVIVSAFISIHTSRKQGKINKASILAKLPHPEAALNGRIAERSEEIGTMDSDKVVGKICSVVEGWRWTW